MMEIKKLLILNEMLVAEQRKLSKQVKVIRLRALAENKRSRKNNYYKKEIYFTEKLGCRMSSSLEFVRESSSQLMSQLRAPEYFGKLLKTEKQKNKQTKSCLILKLWLEQWKTLQFMFVFLHLSILSYLSLRYSCH